MEKKNKIVLFITKNGPTIESAHGLFSRRSAHARRPRHGSGPGFYFPTWANLGLVIASRSSRIDGCALLPAEQNQHSGETLVPTNPHSRSLFRAPHRSIGVTTGPAMGGG
jgi:hypothetical protein